MLAQDAKAEGWKWVEIQPDVDHQAVSRYRRVYAPELPLSTEAQAEINTLEERRDHLADQLEEEKDAD